MLLDFFLEQCGLYSVTRVYVWGTSSEVNLGMMVRVYEVLELHYIHVKLS